MIAIISDIHGNYPALKAVLDEIDTLKCKQIICLGDIAGYYCMINECISLLKSRNIIYLKGNHDNYLIKNILSGRSKAADRCISYQKKNITFENLNWLSSSVESYQKDDTFMVHGGWNDFLEEYLYNISNEYFQNFDEKYFFSGHSHVQFIAKLDDKVYCNPGSVGQPRDGDNRAAYALFHDDKSIELKRVDYDIDFIALKMKKTGFEPYFYQNLYSGVRLDGGISKIKVVEV